MDIIVYTSGASGTLFSTIRATVENSGATVALNRDDVGVGRITRAVDTTVENRVALEVKVSTSDASAVIKCEEFTLEQLN